MNDLQASFQAVKDVIPLKAPPLRAVPPPEPPSPQVAKAPEGVVRERLTDALAALAPVIKLDHTPGIRCRCQARRNRPLRERPRRRLTDPISTVPPRLAPR